MAESPRSIASTRGGPIANARAASPGSSATALADDVGFLLARAGGRAIRDINRALEPLRLRSRHYTVLAASAEHGGLSQRALGTMLAVDPSAIVALVDDLEKAGLVRRDPHPADRRTRLVVTTDQGQTTLAHARSLAAHVADEQLAPLSDDERAVLVDLLRRITIG